VRVSDLEDKNDKIGYNEDHIARQGNILIISRTFSDIMVNVFALT
jgi:uncharacterized protein YaaR (DUF327 family)